MLELPSTQQQRPLPTSMSQISPSRPGSTTYKMGQDHASYTRWLTIRGPKESADSTLRRVSRDTRWHAFLFHGKYYWGEILSQYFLPPGKSTENLPMDDDEVLRAKAKIFDAIKNIKSDTLKKFDSHVDQA
jgi:hypothetical protein